VIGFYAYHRPFSLSIYYRGDVILAAKKIVAGKYFDPKFGSYGTRNRMFDHSILSREEVLELIRLYQSGNERAVSKLIQYNLKFIFKMTCSLISTTHPHFWDVFDEGCFGIVRAAEDFDPDRGYKFITYAVWWIRQRQNAYLTEHVHTVVVPERHRSKIKKEFLESLPKNAVEHGMVKRHGLKALKIETEADMISLDSPSPHDLSGKTTYIDCLAAEPDQDQFVSELTSVIPKVLSRLKPMDSKLIRDYYGLDTGIPKTYADIAMERGVSRERIRQLGKRAMRYLYWEVKRLGDVDKTDLGVFG
jgi:RNA polymerase primary sigma factor